MARVPATRAGAILAVADFEASLAFYRDRLGLEVVAEGIEREDQSDSLRDLGCQLGQGFLFARPMTEDALLQYLFQESPAPGELVAGTAP